MKIGVIGALALCASFSYGGTVWYGGDDDGLNGWAAVSGTPNGQGNLEFMAFENFVWNSSSSAGTIMGTMLGLSSFSQVKWEIRSGMDVTTQNAGTLLASGVSNVNLVSLGQWSLSNAFTEYAMTGDISPVALTNGGSYFLGMAIVVPNSNFTGGFTSTAGTNSVGSPIQDHNSFSMTPSGTLVYYQDGFGANQDLSMGIGTAAVPEPMSMVALGIGALLLRRRKQK